MTDLARAWWTDLILRVAWFPESLLKCPCLRRRRRRERGTVTVEYVVLLTTVAIGLTIAVVGLGVPLVRLYLSQTAILGLPFP